MSKCGHENRCVDECANDEVQNLERQMCVSECNTDAFEIDVNDICVCDRDDSGIDALLNLQGDACVTDCGDDRRNLLDTRCTQECDLNEITIGGKCQCNSMSVLNQDRDGCVTTPCAEPTGLNLRQDQCIMCPAPAQVRNSDGVCVCAPTYVLNEVGSQCVQNECTGQVLNFDGTACIDMCPQGQTRAEGDLNQCVCDSPMFVLNLERNACVQNCGDDEDKGDETCDCNENTLINQAGNACVDNCQDDEVIDIDGEKCVSDCTNEGTNILNLNGDQCVEACVADEQVEVENRCVCNMEMNYVFDSQQTQCVDDCTSISQVLNIAGDQCVPDCSNELENILNIAGDQCVQDCSNQLNNLLNLVGDQCVSQCQNLESINEGRCQCSAPQTVLNNAETGCICNDDMLYFPVSDGTSCTQDCVSEGQVLNVNGDECVEDCSGQQENTLNFDQTQCVTSCPDPQQVRNNIGVCVCNSPMFQLEDGVCEPVIMCGPNQYQDGEQCFDCDETCNGCTDSATACSACATGFGLVNEVCTRCTDPNCRQCIHSRQFCYQCSNGPVRKSFTCAA